MLGVVVKNRFLARMFSASSAPTWIMLWAIVLFAVDLASDLQLWMIALLPLVLITEVTRLPHQISSLFFSSKIDKGRRSSGRISFGSGDEHIQKTPTQLMSSASASRNWAEVLSLFTELEQTNQVNSQSLILAVSALGAMRKWQQALDLLTNLDDYDLICPTTNLMNAGLHALVPSRRWEEAIWLLEEHMPKCDIQLDVASYNAAISVCSAADRSEEAENFLDVMASDGIVPTVASYAQVIRAMGARRWSASLTLLRKMQEKIGADVSVFSQVIRNCGNARRWRESLRLLREMQTSRMSPDVVAFNSAITACGFAQQIPEAMGLLDEMSSCGIEPDAVTYNTLLAALAQSKGWQHAISLIERMSEHLVPDVVSYSAAISACSKQWEEALKMLRRMQEEQVRPNLVSYNACISACGQARRWETSLALFRECDALEPTAVTYNATLSALSIAGKWKMALQLIEEMRLDDRVATNSASYGCIITGLAKAGEVQQALICLLSMLDDGVYPDSPIYTTLLSACQSGEWEHAGQLVHRMQASDAPQMYMDQLRAITISMNDAQWSPMGWETMYEMPPGFDDHSMHDYEGPVVTCPAFLPHPSNLSPDATCDSYGRASFSMGQSMMYQPPPPPGPPPKANLEARISMDWE